MYHALLETHSFSLSCINQDGESNCCGNVDSKGGLKAAKLLRSSSDLRLS
jgi:hypothetical protein